MQEFKEPNWTKPIDLELILKSVPEDAKIKGVFFHSAIKQALKKGGYTPPQQSYSFLSNYPSTELIRVLNDCAKIISPDLPIRQALRHLGQSVFPSMKETTAGTFLFSVAVNNIISAFNLIGKAHKLFSTYTSATANVIDDHNVIIELRNCWTFADSYHVGIIEGALSAYKKNGNIAIRSHSLCDVDMKISWT
jgi:uncharacterized protein (TIGR02265 family)